MPQCARRAGGSATRRAARPHRQALRPTVESGHPKRHRQAARSPGGHMASAASGTWHTTACILCSVNCGIEVQVAADGRRFQRVRGDRAHPASRGYPCEKALRLDHYQNARDRLTHPLRRRPDGTFEVIDWDPAIREIAARLGAIRDTHGGERILYYGGGGQGNHLCGVYASATRRALGMKFRSNALAQEKTGWAWVSEQTVG